MEGTRHPEIDTKELSAFIKQVAGELGFDACGIALAHPLPHDVESQYIKWVHARNHGEMSYMERNAEVRFDPTKLVPGALSVIMVAFNYATSSPPSDIRVARYARRPDYHPLIRKKLNVLLNRIRERGIEVSGRAFSDSAPLAERYWAEQAGLGWLGRNHLLILPGKGSWYLLGALVTTLPLMPDTPSKNRCGHCSRCIDSCPGRAFDEEGSFNARHCISYLTIEKKGGFTPSEERRVQDGASLFGCDICQEVCPWNRFSEDQTRPEFPLLPVMDDLEKSNLTCMDAESFKRTFNGSSLERTGLEALLRNLSAIKKARPSE